MKNIYGRIIAKENFVFGVLLFAATLFQGPIAAQDSITYPRFFADGHLGLNFVMPSKWNDHVLVATHRAFGLGWQIERGFGLGWDVSLSKFVTSGLNVGNLFPIPTFWMLQTGIGVRTVSKRVHTQWIGGALLHYFYSHPESEYYDLYGVIEWIEEEINTQFTPNMYFEGRVGVFLGKRNKTSLTGSFTFHPNLKEPGQVKGSNNTVLGLTFGIHH